VNLTGKLLEITGSHGALGQAVAAAFNRYGARLRAALTGALIPVAGRV
jgi:hypothetical protein